MALIAHRRRFLIAPLNQLPLTGSISPSLFIGPPGMESDIYSPLKLCTIAIQLTSLPELLCSGEENKKRRCLKKEAEVLHVT